MDKIYPQKPGLDKFLKEAFVYWRSTMLYQVAFSLLYFSIFFIVMYYASEKYGILQEYALIVKNNPNDFVKMQSEVQKMVASENYGSFSWYLIGTLVFLYPLNIGLFKIFRKKDLGETIYFGDLFAGYIGVNFFKFTSFYLFWFMAFSLLFPTLILPAIWILVTIFSAPLMFFMNKSIFESVGLNFKALKLYFLEIFVCLLVAFIFRYCGILLFWVGFLFTYPFTLAMIYTLYKHIFIEEEKNVS